MTPDTNTASGAEIKLDHLTAKQIKEIENQEGVAFIPVPTLIERPV